MSQDPSASVPGADQQLQYAQPMTQPASWQPAPAPGAVPQPGTDLYGAAAAPSPYAPPDAAAPAAATPAGGYELGPPPANVPSPLHVPPALPPDNTPALSPVALPDSPKNHDSFRYIHVDARDEKGDEKGAAAIAPAPAPARGHKNCTVCNPQHKFVTNYVSTTKYNLFTFLPLNLFEQFQKKANFYFLLVAVISLTPLSPQTPFVSVAPLVFVLLVSAIKEAIEDYSRYKMDKQINMSVVPAWRRASSSWQDVCWQDLVVGDVVFITADRAFPADLLLLKSSGQQGSCNIETSNLDGETNLKTKQAIPECYNINCSADGRDFPQMLPSAVVESSGPDKSLASSAWKGNIAFNGGEKLALGMDQLLLRGCTLRNTKWVVALVVFTGADTKLVLNNKSSAFKRSNVDRIVDSALYVLFTLQALLCAGGAILNYLWLNDNSEVHWYLGYHYPKDVNISTEAGLSFFTYIVLLNIMIPISLYVSMELVKFAQAYFISTDLAMYYPVTNTPARARTSNLNEELGQVHYIFSDKTGTLTGNIMQFLRCSIAGVSYGDDGTLKPEDTAPEAERHDSIPPHNPLFPCKDNRMMRTLFAGGENGRIVDEFFTQLTVNHTVYPDFPGSAQGAVHDPWTSKAKPVYQAESPDEKALIEASLENQYYFYHREPKAFRVGKLEINGTEIRVNVRGKPVCFEVLETLKFNSTRARMSAIVRDPRDGQIKIYCKGADSKIYARLTRESQENAWNATDQHLSEFAKKGLRTLCLAYRVVPEAEFIEWYEKHKVALATIDNREHHVTESQKRIENDFTLLGATAIEDQLQHGVPECIAKLALAGIRIWVLTGDKVETAINIGKSCELLTPKMLQRQLMLIHVEESVKEDEARSAVLRMLHDLAPTLHGKEEASDDCALVISGRALGFIFGMNRDEREAMAEQVKSQPPGAQADFQKQLQEEAATRLLFLQIAQKCKAVICCRVSPAQKAEVVTLVKDNVAGVITLAIGDGANDVPMIKSAHVGIGIAGLEGLQAVMASDYAIAQFRFLERLLLVHGAWSYRRTALLINYSFYKNMIISFLQVIFAFYCGFSGQLYYDPYAGSAYNIVFTSFPILFAAAFNRDVSAKNLLRFPQLYASGPRNEHFGIGLLVLHLFEAVLQSLALFFFAVMVFNDSSTRDGTSNDQWVGSMAMYSYLVLLVNIRVGLDVRSWTWISWLFSALSILVWFIFGLIYSNLLVTPNIYGVSGRVFGMPIFWCGYVGLPIACLIPELAYRYIQRTYFPTALDIVAEIDRLEEIHGTDAAASGLQRPTLNSDLAAPKPNGSAGAAAAAGAIGGSEPLTPIPSEPLLPYPQSASPAAPAPQQLNSGTPLAAASAYDHTAVVAIGAPGDQKQP